jgi:hypothetical protein
MPTSRHISNCCAVGRGNRGEKKEKKYGQKKKITAAHFLFLQSLNQLQIQLNELRYALVEVWKSDADMAGMSCC